MPVIHDSEIPDAPTTEPSIEVAPAVIEADPFDTATYYDEDDTSESLSHETPEEALEDWLDSEVDSDETMVDAIERLCPVTITAWKPLKFSEVLIKGYAEDVLDHILERLGENEVEYFDPDGEGPDISTEHKALVMPDAIALVTKLLSGVHIWGCEIVATRTYTAGQVEALMRHHCPSWFEVQP